MLSRRKGLVGRILKDNPDLITYHCIIHQTVLCASLGDEYRKFIFSFLFIYLFYIYIYPPDSQESDGGANT